MREFLPELWEGGLRALDDIRESTRNAASTCMKALSEQVVGLTIVVAMLDERSRARLPPDAFDIMS